MHLEWTPQPFFNTILQPGTWSILLAICGLMVGSFLNVIIYRLPIMIQNKWREEACHFLQSVEPSMLNQHAIQEAADTSTFNLVAPRSHCPACDHKIAWYHNIPLISFFVLKGRCQNCQHAISLLYPFIESLTAILFVIAGIVFGLKLTLLFVLFFISTLIAMTFIDIAHQLLPDELTLPTLWLGLLVNSANLLCPLKDAVIGAVLGYLFLWFVYQAFKVLTGKEGMGYGDFKLLAMMGAWIGWQPLPFVILIASAVGLLVGGYRILRGIQHHSQPIPFGPFLAFGGVVMLIWQQIS